MTVHNRVRSVYCYSPSRMNAEITIVYVTLYTYHALASLAGNCKPLQTGLQHNMLSR